MNTKQTNEPQSLNDVLKLGVTDYQATFLKFFPKMTGWFEPGLLCKLLLRVIVSDLFGQYADRRLVHAALDRQTSEDSRKTTSLVDDLKRPDGETWIDFVADLGDGFDSTYAIAYLLAQPTLTVAGVETPLPRGGALFMGGDEVYPTANRDAYTSNMRKLYELAWPLSKEKSPSLFALPGNHDWYDGLVVFLALFCRIKRTSFGNWLTRQRRSYFSAQLNEKWWLWGIDIALVRDMDQPQADYFVDAAVHMPEGANIILCSAEPGWYKAEEGGDSYRTLDYAALIAKRADRKLRIPLVLSGDSHHYARYVGANSQFITSGGGGAFLHGTLELKPEIKANWLGYKDDSLRLQKTYPTPEESKTLLDTHMDFFGKNLGFCFMLGVTYWLFSFALTSLYRLDVGIIIFFTMFAVFWAYSGYQEKSFSWLTFALSLAHSAAHFAVVWILSAIALRIASYFSITNWHWFFWALYLSWIIPLGAYLSGKIFGFYLQKTCRDFDRNHNDAFSSMKLDSHRNFLRLRVVGDSVTVFPICVDAVPARDGWTKNENRSDEHPSVFKPTKPMGERLIEEPITIDAVGALSTKDVRPTESH